MFFHEYFIYFTHTAEHLDISDSH